MKRLTLAVLVAVLVALVSPPAHAGDKGHHSHRTCQHVHARGVGRETSPGKTTATIFVRGVEVGTTTASFMPTGMEGTVASFVGPLTFTSDLGAIVAQTAGTLDTATGNFVARSRDLTGTGDYSGITGRIKIRGTEDFTDLSFTERISGRVCFPKN
jgi:hypothetical protein